MYPFHWPLLTVALPVLTTFSCTRLSCPFPQRAAMALARMAPETELRTIFCGRHRGLDVLLDVMSDAAAVGTQQRDAAAALLELVRKVTSMSGSFDCMPAQPPKTVYLGSQVRRGGDAGPGNRLDWLGCGWFGAVITSARRGRDQGLDSIGCSMFQAVLTGACWGYGVG